MAKVGDEIELASTKVGQEARRGTVTAMVGSLLTVKWASGEESMFIPGPGSLAVLAAKGTSPIGKGRSPRNSPVKRAC